MSTKEGSGAVASAMAMPVLCGGAGLLAAALIAGMASLLPPNAAQATPQYAAQTGKPCGFCHVSPSGGGKLGPNGDKFRANDHKL